jgi:hypothetical protein
MGVHTLILGSISLAGLALLFLWGFVVIRVFGHTAANLSDGPIPGPGANSA